MTRISCHLFPLIKKKYIVFNNILFAIVRSKDGPNVRLSLIWSIDSVTICLVHLAGNKITLYNHVIALQPMLLNICFNIHLSVNLYWNPRLFQDFHLKLTSYDNDVNIPPLLPL